MKNDTSTTDYGVVGRPLRARLRQTTAFHVGATSDGGAGTDPNLISSPLSFFIADNPNKSVASPLTIYFAVPDGEPMPVVTSVLYKGTTSETISSAVATFGSDYTAAANKDFYSFVGCTGCDNSLQFVNLSAGESHDQPGVLPNPPIAYDVYKMVVDVAFKGKDFIEVNGAFADGTYIVPRRTGSTLRSPTSVWSRLTRSSTRPLVGCRSPRLGRCLASASLGLASQAGSVAARIG